MGEAEEAEAVAEAPSKSELEDKISLILSRINRVLRRIYLTSSASIVGLWVTTLVIAHSSSDNHSKGSPVAGVLQMALHLPAAPLLKIKGEEGVASSVVAAEAMAEAREVTKEEWLPVNQQHPRGAIVECVVGRLPNIKGIRAGGFLGASQELVMQVQILQEEIRSGSQSRTGSSMSAIECFRKCLWAVKK